LYLHFWYLETCIWAAISKEDTDSGELQSIPAMKLKGEDWVQTVQYDNDGTPTFGWTQIKRVWIMELAEQLFMSNVKGNLVTEHHNVSVQDTGDRMGTCILNWDSISLPSQKPAKMAAKIDFCRG